MKVTLGSRLSGASRAATRGEKAARTTSPDVPAIVALPRVVKVRPFAVLVDPNDDERRQRDCLPLLRLAGAIDGDLFVLSVGAADVELSATQLGVDTHGEFALIEIGEGSLLNGFRVKIEPISAPDREDSALSGCVIVLTRNAAPSSCLAIYFGSDGATCFLREPRSQSDS
jgi:hypothetical protein